MFNYEAEIDIRRMERERHLKALELQRLSRWMAFSERLDALIEASENGAVPADPPAQAVAAGPRTPGLRARLAVRLVRLARALHPEAAAGAARAEG